MIKTIFLTLITISQLAIPIFGCDYCGQLSRAQHLGGRIFTGDRKILESEIKNDLYVYGVSKIKQKYTQPDVFRKFYG